MKLSIIFPAYNEEKRIIPILENYYNFFKEKLKSSFEFIVIPNNCSDKTFEIVKKFSFNKKNIFVYNIPCYVGKGGAIIKGFELAKGNLIGFVDSDESTSPEEFYKLYKNIGEFDGIIASRKMKGAKIFPKREIKKRTSSFLFNIFVRILFGLKFKDTQCGAKLFKKDVAKFLSENLTEKGWEFDVDLLYLCKKRKYKIKEFPISWKDCVGSHLTTLKGINSILSLIKYRLFFKHPKH